MCCPYTSRDEITTAIRNSVKSVEQGRMRIRYEILYSHRSQVHHLHINFLSFRDLDEHVIEQNLFTAKSPPLDILVRTSGEIRLSDFLLWQVSLYTVIGMCSVYGQVLIVASLPV